MPVFSDEGMAKEFAETRIKPAIRSSPVISESKWDGTPAKYLVFHPCVALINDDLRVFWSRYAQIREVFR